MCTGFSFSFLVFHRVTTRVNDATNSSIIRLWYLIPFHKFGLLLRRLRRKDELQLLRGKNVSQRGRASCNCCEERISHEGRGRVAVIFAKKECLAKGR